MPEELSKLPDKINIYDKLLFFFVFLQAFGQIGGALQPIRIFVILLIPVVFLFSIKNIQIMNLYRFEIYFFCIWIIYGILSLLWVISLPDSLKEISYLIVNFMAFFTIIFLANKSNKPQESILKGWMALFAITFPIAIYEFLTDIHLPIATQSDGMVMNYAYNVFERRFASVTYGNLNEYNLVLCYSLPFIFGAMLRPNTKIKRFFVVAMILGLTYIVIMNGSRGAVISMLIGYFVFVFYYFKTYRSIAFILVLFIALLFLSIYYFDEIFFVILSRFSEQGLSDDGRSQIFSNGVNVFFNTFMFGVGAGNFMPTMDKVYQLELTSPHNLFLEIGVQYGLMIFMCFIYLLIKLYRTQRMNNDNLNKYVVMSALLMFPFTAAIDSGYLLNSWIWMFLSSLYILADGRYNASYNG